MSNGVRPDIQFTAEKREDHPNGRIPMLDIEVWCEEDKGGNQALMYSFYEKMVASDLVILKKSAVDEKTKVTTLSQTVIRICRNICREASIRERAGKLNELMNKMKRSGYSSSQREDILKAGLVGYYRMLRTELLGGRKVNRGKEDGREER